MPRALPIAEQLRRAIKDAERRGMSRYAIAKAAGLSMGHFYRVARDNGTPRIDVAEKILDTIGLQLTISPKKRIIKK
jgi:DNA-binding phage protein